MGAETQLATPEGSVELRRLPHHPDSPLRAWDAADELAIAHVRDAEIGADARVLVVNDLFGALAVALHAHRPLSWGDSVTSHQAAGANLGRNGLDPGGVEFVPSSRQPDGPIDLAVIKVPRSLALLEDQLRTLRPLLHEGSIVAGAGMVKAIHTSTIDLFESLIGPSPTSLAKKKARLILSSLDTELDIGPSPFPSRYRIDSGAELIEHANVFSRGRLDIGSRVMLDHLPAVDPGTRVVDLGCGNGVLGLTLGATNDLGSLVLVDESYHATASARLNAQGWGLGEITEVHAERTLSFLPDNSVDLVLNNPPFHTHQSRTDDTAKAMFADAQRVLKPGGRLVVVGNRHLGYHKMLKRRFGGVEVVGSSPKFVVLQATAGEQR